MSIKSAIKEIKAVREHDERQERIDSISSYNAVINYGDILTKNEKVHLTIWATLQSGEVVEVVGEFIPKAIHY